MALTQWHTVAASSAAAPFSPGTVLPVCSYHADAQCCTACIRRDPVQIEARPDSVQFLADHWAGQHIFFACSMTHSIRCPGPTVMLLSVHLSMALQVPHRRQSLNNCFDLCLPGWPLLHLSRMSMLMTSRVDHVRLPCTNAAGRRQGIAQKLFQRPFPICPRAHKTCQHPQA